MIWPRYVKIVGQCFSTTAAVYTPSQIAATTCDGNENQIHFCWNALLWSNLQTSTCCHGQHEQKKQEKHTYNICLTSAAVCRALCRENVWVNNLHEWEGSKQVRASHFLKICICEIKPNKSLHHFVVWHYTYPSIFLTWKRFLGLFFMPHPWYCPNVNKWTAVLYCVRTDTSSLVQQV